MSTENAGSRERAQGPSQIPMSLSYHQTERFGKELEGRYDLKNRVSRAILAGASYTMEKVIDAINSRFDQVDSRFDQVDRRFDKVDRRLDQVDKRLDQVDRRFDKVDERFDQVTGEFCDMKKREKKDKRSHLYGVLGIVATVLLSCAGIVVTILLT